MTCLASGAWDSTVSGACSTCLTALQQTRPCLASSSCCSNGCGWQVACWVPDVCLHKQHQQKQHVHTCPATPPLLCSCHLCVPADWPTNCSAIPSATLVNGNWPASCAGSAFGSTCTGNCTYGGGPAEVTCFNNASWSSTATGACAGKHRLQQAYSSLGGVEQLDTRLLACMCAMEFQVACTRRHLFLSSALACTQWEGAQLTTVSRNAQHVPRCPLLSVLLLVVVVVLVAAADPPPSCSGLPSPNPAYGVYPDSCTNMIANQTCVATCTFGGSASVGCQASGTWNSTVVGVCNRE